MQGLYITAVNRGNTIHLQIVTWLCAYSGNAGISRDRYTQLTNRLKLNSEIYLFFLVAGPSFTSAISIINLKKNGFIEQKCRTQASFLFNTYIIFFEYL